MRKKLRQDYGWMFLAKQVSDWTGETYYDIMNKPTTEVLGVVVVIKAQSELER